MPPIVFGRWKAPVALLVLTFALSACGQIGPAAEQPITQPLSPAPATVPQHAGVPITAVPAPSRQETSTPQRTVKPTPPSPNSTIAFLRTSVARGRNNARATSTAKALWAQTPEPTILPPAGGDRLRDLWPASPQAASAPSRLYLRNRGGHRKPDTFWEVRLPDMELRRLPAVEQESVDDAAQVSPDGRFLAYVTGTPRRDLRLLDLASDADVGVDVAVIDGINRCRRQIAWSPDGRTLAALAIVPKGTDWVDQLRLYQPHTGPKPQLLLEQRPGTFELLGWLDEERLLVMHWSRKAVEPARLLSVDRQGNQRLLHTVEPGLLACSSLSPDGRDLIYNQNKGTHRVQLATGEEERFSLYPNEFFWLGDGRTLLVSRFDYERTVWLHPLDQPEQQRSLFLSPPYQSDYRFGITGVSPDGSLLVACEHPSGTNPRIRSSTARTWLYDIAQDRWIPIRDSTTSNCDLVLGWSLTEGGR